MLEYRGHVGSIDFSDEDEVFLGRLEFIRGLVTYEATDARGLKGAFREAVDDCLALCEAKGRKPDVPLKGGFNVRPGGALHRRAMLHARRTGKTLNAVPWRARRSVATSSGRKRRRSDRSVRAAARPGGFLDHRA